MLLLIIGFFKSSFIFVNAQEKEREREHGIYLHKLLNTDRLLYDSLRYT